MEHWIMSISELLPNSKSASGPPAVDLHWELTQDLRRVVTLLLHPETVRLQAWDILNRVNINCKNLAKLDQHSVQFNISVIKGVPLGNSPALLGQNKTNKTWIINQRPDPFFWMPDRLDNPPLRKKFSSAGYLAESHDAGNRVLPISASLPLFVPAARYISELYSRLRLWPLLS